jgi:thiol-disulfide isomerase/thioredoxin
MGYSKCNVSSPTVKALQGCNVVGLFFGADWCKPCSEFIPVLDRLYSAQAAQGAHWLEIVLVLCCREAKATKYCGFGMLWLSMYHNANDKVVMKTRMTALMAKFGITTIPALVLLDKHGQVICIEGRGWCDADLQGLAFPWQDQPRVGPVA